MKIPISEAQGGRLFFVKDNRPTKITITGLDSTKGTLIGKHISSTNLTVPAIDTIKCCPSRSENLNFVISTGGKKINAFPDSPIFGRELSYQAITVSSAIFSPYAVYSGPFHSLQTDPKGIIIYAFSSNEYSSVGDIPMNASLTLIGFRIENQTFGATNGGGVNTAESFLLVQIMAQTRDDIPISNIFTNRAFMLEQQEIPIEAWENPHGLFRKITMAEKTAVSEKAYACS